MVTVVINVCLQLVQYKPKAVSFLPLINLLGTRNVAKSWEKFKIYTSLQNALQVTILIRFPH